MKSLVVAVSFVASCMASSLVMACVKPAAKPVIPEATDVATAQMIKANNDVKVYVQAVEAYLGCAGLARNEEKKELDELKQFAEDFNKVVREFKARSAS